MVTEAFGNSERSHSRIRTVRAVSVSGGVEGSDGSAVGEGPNPGPCYYCRKESSVPANRALDQKLGKPIVPRSLCCSCSMAYMDHLMALLEKVPQGLSGDRELEVLREVDLQLEAWMHEHCRRRRPRPRLMELVPAGRP